MIDQRFPTALQIMHCLLLARRQGSPVVTSGEFATGLATNPVFVRRLLANLAQAGLVTAHRGRNGGVELARDGDQISLSDIYRAASGNKEVWAPRPDVPHRCVISTNFETYFRGLTREADTALYALLAGYSLAQSLDRLLTLADEAPMDAVPTIAG